MNGIAALILEWLNGSPRRTIGCLARATGVPRQTICNILSGREPTIEVAARLAKVLPRRKVLLAICNCCPEFCTLIGVSYGVSDFVEEIIFAG